jgi:Subtilase family/CARDB
MSKTRIALVVVTVFSLLGAWRAAPSVSFAQGTGSVYLKSRSLHMPNTADEALQPLAQLRQGERKRMILKLDAVPDAEARQALETGGVKLLHYINNNAWYASVDGASNTGALRRHGVKAAWKIEAADRLAPALYQNRIPKHAMRADGSVALNVEAFDDADLQEVAAQVQSAGGVVDSAVPALGTLFVHIPPQFIWSLGLIDGVHWVGPVSPAPTAEMNRVRDYLGVSTVQAAPFSLTGDGVKVSVHDFGHAFRHNDYFNRWTKDSDTLTVDHHATLTAGTIAGDGTVNSTFKGMAPGASLLTFSFSGGSNCCEANNFADIADALMQGVDIANNSWGNGDCTTDPFGDYSSLARVFDREVLGKDSGGTKIGKPTVVVFSAGNVRDGSETGDNHCITHTSAPFENYGTINQPHTAKNIITVGAVDSANDRMSSFSAWGPTSDGRLKPDIVAAGLHNGNVSSSISSIPNQAACFGNPVGSANQQCYRTTNDSNTDIPNNGFDDRYAWFAQTSAAAAEVSGSAALFVQDFRAKNSGRSPLPSTVKAHFIHTARDLNDSTTTWYTRGPDYASGYGVVQVDDAISKERQKRWSEASVSQGQTNTFFMNVPPLSTSVKVTLAWDDAPGDPGSATSALVNDLDLIVTDPSGRRIFPWTLNPASPSDPAVRNGEDHLNNVEEVEVTGIGKAGVQSGLWKVQVRGTTVPVGPQTYSLVYTFPPDGGDVDLLVTGLTLTLTGPPTNPVVNIVASITNRGPDTAGASVTRYFVSTNPVFNSSATFLGQRSIPVLAAGGISTTTTAITVPPNITLGKTYYVFAIADADNAVAENFETNNVGVVQITLALP